MHHRGVSAASDGAVDAVAPSDSRAIPSRRIIFAIVAMALFMWSVDAAIVATALPAIHHSLRATINWAGWTITIYSL